ncbi:hypothetical protein [Peribacillus glennii]|uniref:Beta-carotene 15,15'-monooxygenase n=1 Tax=Peribacillus glennii TaxID=2303991 RepID=A0A372LC93_9BACI|nr:hypothetical protein [Peribacillus glennii]RFU63476.1 hypothetical protein D0466_12145 [Peribacillus glennii]
MVFNFQSRKTWVLLGLIVLVLLSNIILHQQAALEPLPKWAVFGSLLDFIISIPLLVYFLVLRKKYSAKWILPVIAGGFFLAGFIIPDRQLVQFEFVTWVIYGVVALFILLEIYLLSAVVKKVPQLISTWKKVRSQEPFFMLALQKTGREVFEGKNVLDFIAFDISLYHYGLFSWRSAGREKVDGEYFTYHKNTGYLAFVIMIIHALVLESVGFHFWIHGMNPMASWIMLALNVYGILYILADYQTVKLCPLRIKDGNMTMQIGISRHLELPLELISDIREFEERTISKEEQKKIFSVSLAEFIPEHPQYEILLKEPVMAGSAYGIKRIIEKIHIRVDDPQAFYRAVKEKNVDTSDGI